MEDCAHADRGHFEREIMKKIILACLVALLSSFTFAHSGGTDSMGCHTNHKTGLWHCH